MRKNNKKHYFFKNKISNFVSFFVEIKHSISRPSDLLELDRKISKIHRSGQTHFKALSGVHNHLRSRSNIYYQWHLNPHHRTVHLGTLTVTSFLIITMILSSAFTDPNLTQAANFTKSWTSTTEFNTATNSNINTAGDQSVLAKSTTDFTESFLDTIYKDAATTATWDATAHKLILPGDPANGTATDLQTKWKRAVAVNESVASTAYDPTNKYVYMGGSAGSFVSYKPSTGEMLSLTLKVKTAWSTNGLNSMKFDSTNGVIYFGSADKVAGFGAFVGGADPMNGTFTNLETKVTADWAGGKIQSMTYDSFAGKIYVGGVLGGFGVFTGGSDPSTGTWLNLTSKISANWSSNPVNGLAYDFDAKNIYLAGGATTVKKFSFFTPGSDPSTGTWASLDAKITDADWGSNMVNALFYDSVNSKIYLGGQNSKFGSFTGGTDPANGTWVYLTGKIMGDWAGTTVGRMNFDSTNGVIYLAGGYRFGAFKGGSDPANGTYSALGSKYGADWPSTFSDIAFDSFAGNIYITGGYGRFGTYSAVATPANGTATINFDISGPFFKSYAQPQSSAFDSTNGIVYYGDDGGNFLSYNTATGVATNLKTRISGSWGNSAIYTLDFDATNHMIYLGGPSGRFGAYTAVADPTTGVWTYLNSKITADWSTNAVNTVTVDTTNGKTYLGGAGGKFGVFTGGTDPTNGTWANLTTKISTDWSANAVSALAFDSTNNKMYLGGVSGKFGAFAGGSDPANGTWSYLSAKISADWTTGNFYSLTFDTANHYIYLSGATGRFGAFLGGATPANGTWVNLYSKVSADISNQNIYALKYTSGRLFLGAAQGKFGAFAGGSDPANGTWSNLASKISPFWANDGNNDNIYTITYAPSAATVYIGGPGGKIASYLAGFSTNKDGISAKINSTAQKILQATLGATASTPTNTGATYYLSNDGGATWEAATLNSAHVFTSTGSDLRWKINLTSTDVLATPEITTVTLGYQYFTSNTGTQNFVFDAGSAVTPYTLSWSKTLPTNTSLAFKIRSAALQASLSAATWSDTRNSAQTPTNLMSVNVGGNIGLAENRWVEIQVDYTTTDGLDTPVLESVDYTYVLNVRPEVQNITAAQRSDGSGIVNINYDIRDQDTSSNPYNAGQIEVLPQYSLDEGVSWNDCVTTTGFGLKNVGEVNFTSYQGTWDMGAVLTNTKDIAIVRLLINDNELAKNTAQANSTSFTIDTKAPVAGGTPMIINSADAKTNNKLISIALNITDDSSIEVSVAEDGQSFTTWQDYATTVSFTIPSSGDGNKTINVKARDIYGNELSTILSDTIELDTFAPSPSHTVLVDGSVIASSDYRVLLSWDTLNNSDFVAYVVERSVNNQSSFTELTRFTARATNAYSDRSLNSANTYYYRMYSTDALSNQSAYSTVISITPTGTDSTPPAITGVDPNTIVTDNTVTISWLTDENSNSFIEYGATASYGDIQGKEGSNTSHTVTVGGLSPSTHYHFRVRSTDESGNLVLGDDMTFTTDVSRYDTTAPTLVNGNPQVEATDVSARVTWSTNESADSFVEFGLNTSYGETQGKVEFVTDHTVSLSGLIPSTNYHYRILSRDASGNLLTGLDHTFSSAENTLDVAGPRVTGPDPKATPTSISAKVSWITNENSDSFVDFGTAADYGSTQGKVESTKDHEVELIGLKPDTLYYFRIRTRDSAGNLTVGEGFTFRTKSAASEAALPNISGATAQKAGADPEEVTIIWATDKPSTSQVLYGLTETNLDQSSTEDTALNTTHYVQIKKLKPNTKYYYMVRSVDQYGNEKKDEIKYFVTTDTSNELPSISAVKVTDITMNSAIVTWRSNVVATSALKYGISDAYGSTIDDLSLGSTTVHTVRLSDLVSGTEYHFRVLGLSTANLNISSDDYIFSTLTLPIISNIIIRDVTANKATITWQTNVPADSFVDFGTDSAKLDESQGRSEEVSEHTVTLNNLKPATDYIIRVKSRDKYANLATAENKTFKTIIDTTAPIIKDLKSETSNITDSNGESKAQVIVSWSTDEPATSQIKYSQGVVAGNAYTTSTPEENNLTTSHIVIISSLQPSTTYHMMIVSKDSSSNIGTSDDYSVITLTQDKSLVQYIIQILEDRFSWVRGFGMFN